MQKGRFFMSAMETVKRFVIEYPKNIIQLLKNKQKILDRLEQECRDEKWYFSPEGKKEYESLSSLAQKTHFFLNYLVSVAKTPDCREYLYRIAFVMANSMVNSGLDFGGYPNILDEDKNPLVRYIKNEVIVSKEEYTEIYCGKFLCVLHTGTDEQDNLFIDEQKPFTRISYCKENEPLTEMYRIERDIISVFAVKEGKSTFVPYIYSILPDSNDDDDVEKDVEDIDDEE